MSFRPLASVSVVCPHVVSHIVFLGAALSFPAFPPLIGRVILFPLSFCDWFPPFQALSFTFLTSGSPVGHHNITIIWSPYFLVYLISTPVFLQLAHWFPACNSFVSLLELNHLFMFGQR